MPPAWRAFDMAIAPTLRAGQSARIAHRWVPQERCWCALAMPPATVALLVRQSRRICTLTSRHGSWCRRIGAGALTVPPVPSTVNARYQQKFFSTESAERFAAAIECRKSP
jgi:hypothetical protein